MGSISVEELHNAASRASGGLTDFGPNDYLLGLRELISAADTSSHAGEALRAKVVASTVDVLAGRLASQEGWKERPACLTLDVRSPVIVIGLPRSGTTALHQVMALDTQFQWIPAWMASRPKVRPPRSAWHNDPLFRQSVERYDTEGPNTLHDVGPSDPQECIRVMQQSFVSMIWVSTLPVPDYHEWFLTQDETASYERFRDNLRLMGADTPSLPWLLKNPSHTFGLSALLKVFPDARVVHIFRDPVETIVSGASLVSATAGDTEATFTAKEIGVHRLRMWSLAAERMEEVRAARPADQFIDVDYRAFVADPLTALKLVYRHFGLSFSPEMENNIRNWVRERPKDRLGRHEYAPSDYGLSAQTIRRRMGGYIGRYGLT